MRELSPIFVASNEDAKRRRFDGGRLVDELNALNVPAVPAIHLPIDVMWTCDGQPIACDCKTPEDFIASYTDGRLHAQITAMQNMACRFFFILLEGDPLSQDGLMVGGFEHGWTWDAFDDALFDTQLYGGVKVVRSPSKARTPRRLAALYKWSAKDDGASWATPVPFMPENDFNSNPPLIFFDRGYRNKVGTLMHIPGWGAKYADMALQALSFQELLGTDPERLLSTRKQLEAIKGFGPKRIQAWEDFLTK